MAVHAEALAKIAATGLAGVFAGASAFISLAQHPALLETGELGFQAPFFRRMYFYAARTQGPMAVVSGINALVVYVLQRDRLADASAQASRSSKLWLASGCVMLAITPFTVATMLRLNYELTNPKLCRSRGQSWLQSTLIRWGRLHSVRTGASLLAFTSMVAAMAYASSSTGYSATLLQSSSTRQHCASIR